MGAEILDVREMTNVFAFNFAKLSCSPLTRECKDDFHETFFLCPVEL